MMTAKADNSVCYDTERNRRLDKVKDIKKYMRHALICQPELFEQYLAQQVKEENAAGSGIKKSRGCGKLTDEYFIFKQILYLIELYLKIYNHDPDRDQSDDVNKIRNQASALEKRIRDRLASTMASRERKRQYRCIKKVEKVLRCKLSKKDYNELVKEVA